MNRKSNMRGGFTLIEIMVVLAIVGILATFLVPRIIDRPDQARVIKARQDILQIHQALQMYRLDNGFYPSTEQGLEALVIRPETDPVPILDGGHLVTYLYEMITRRRVSVKARETGYKVGFALLILLMVFAFYNDITRFFR